MGCTVNGGPSTSLVDGFLSKMFVGMNCYGNYGSFLYSFSVRGTSLPCTSLPMQAKTCMERTLLYENGVRKTREFYSAFSLVGFMAENINDMVSKFIECCNGEGILD